MRHLSVVLACLTLSTTAWALNPNDRVDNFELLDQTGASHELYYLSDASAVVLMSHGNGCNVVSDVIPQFKAVRAAYEKQGVAFLMINSNLGDSREAIARLSRVERALAIGHPARRTLGPRRHLR